MKEKTAELKEKIEKDYKDMMAVINSTSLPLFVEDTIEDMHILIETLIAENKELKEERDIYRSQLNSAFSNGFIHKSKVEELQNKYKSKIEKLESKKIWNEPVDTINKNRYVNYYNAYEELLGEE